MVRSPASRLGRPDGLRAVSVDDEGSLDTQLTVQLVNVPSLEPEDSLPSATGTTNASSKASRRCSGTDSTAALTSAMLAVGRSDDFSLPPPLTRQGERTMTWSATAVLQMAASNR